MSENKKNKNPSYEMKDEELDKVSGGVRPTVGATPQATWHGQINEQVSCICRWCWTEFLYRPGIDKNNYNDPARHFCCKEHQELWQRENGYHDR